MLARLFGKPKQQPATTPELKSTPLPESLLSSLKNKKIIRILQIDDKTCLISKDHIIVYDNTSKEPPAEFKLPPDFTDALPWSQDIILLNCLDTRTVYKIFAFNIKNLSCSPVKAVGFAIQKLQSDNEDILVTSRGEASFMTDFYIANDLEKLKPIVDPNFHPLKFAYDGTGKVSEDHHEFVMKSGETFAIASYQDEMMTLSKFKTIDPRIQRGYLSAIRKEGYVLTDFQQLMLLDSKFNVTACAKTRDSYVRNNITVLPDQQHFLCSYNFNMQKIISE